jgi:integrase
MRAGTEAMNLKWQHISLVKKGATQYLLLNINGKTGHREVPVRNSVATYLRRIQLNDPELKDISFEELLKKGVNKYVFRVNGDDATTKFGRVFKRLLEKTELLIDKRTGKERTLYSLRHYYATRTLTFNQITPYQLAEQMGTSVGMIEKHYGHLNLHNIADKFAGGGTIEGAIGRGKLAKQSKGK